MERNQYIEALRKLQTKPDVEIVGMRAELFNEIVDHTILMFKALESSEGSDTKGWVAFEALEKVTSNSAHISAHAGQ